MKLLRPFIAAVSLLLLMTGLGLAAGSPVAKDKRVALVIGNSAYQHAISLPNPANDARLMATTLRAAGFEVIEGFNLDKAQLGVLTDRFTEIAYSADIAMVYYAGHGLQVDGKNYIIPVDAALTSPAHLKTRALEVEALLEALPPDPAIGIIILDACRDNPLARSLAAALPASRSQGMGQGLAEVQTNLASHGAGGVLIAYATDPGAIALDGDGVHSPYTTALVRHLATPGLEIQSALTRVRGEVVDATGGRQRPWHNASLGREVFIGGIVEVAVAPPITPAADSAAAALPVVDPTWETEQRFWDEAAKRDTPAYYQAYLDQFPHGRFASIARLNIETDKTATLSRASAPDNAVDATQPVTAEQLAAVGTPATDEALGLNKQARIDLQLRLRALGYEIGSVDGDIGKRSRNAIGTWQRGNSLVATTYLTGAQYSHLVAQSEPRMASARVEYEEAQRRNSETRSVASGPPNNRKQTSGGNKDREAGAFAAGIAVGAIGTAIGGRLLRR